MQIYDYEKGIYVKLPGLVFTQLERPDNAAYGWRNDAQGVKTGYV